MDVVTEHVADCARKFKAVERVYLFGSRAKNTHHEKSDYDFAVDWQNVKGESWGDFATTVREHSPTLHSLDLVRLDQASAELKDLILAEGKSIYVKD